jgi:hypothetical protein
MQVMERIIPVCGIVGVEGVGGGGGGMVVIDYGGIGRHSWKAMSVGCVRAHPMDWKGSAFFQNSSIFVEGTERGLLRRHD